jgi:hypothetical protein
MGFLADGDDRLAQWQPDAELGSPEFGFQDLDAAAVGGDEFRHHR